ncbi:hypothetical protein EB077_07630, partial [bacterium]|nr:hypothetical protein [bacterium]
MAGVGTGRKLNLDAISADEVLVNNNGTEAYVKAEIGEKLYKINNEPYVLLRLSDACVTTLSNEEANFSEAFMGLAESIALTRFVSQGGSSSGGIDNIKSQFICGVPVSETIVPAMRSLDSASMNDRRLAPMAVIPTAAAIPMKSNVRVYGPYVSNNFFSSTGGCNVETNTDLAPWVFGSNGVMNTAGQALANAYQAGLSEAESGSATLPGLPGQHGGGIPSLGWLGLVPGGGPNLTGINVSFSSSGINTSYTFQTFTPKFGNLTRSTVDQLKNIARNRQKQLQFLRNQSILSYNISRKLKRVNNNNNAVNKVPNLAEGRTLLRCIMAEMKDWHEFGGDKYGKRTTVGIDTLAKSVLELRYDYDKKAFMSLDGLFGPLSKYGDGGFPRYASYTNQSVMAGLPHKASPLAPHPPVSTSGSCNTAGELDQYNLNISQKYLDPLTNRVTGIDAGGANSHYHDGDGAGHSIDILGRGEDPPEDGMILNRKSQEDPDRYAEDYRFLGLRGPLVLHSWGYDTDGKPIPNASDSDSSTASGSFTKENLKDKFLSNWLNKPQTWPAAPVDLRFDRERGMWVSPQSYKIVVAKIMKEVPAYGQGTAVIINNKDGNKYYKDLYDSNGNIIQNAANPQCSDSDTPTYKWVLTSIGTCPTTTTLAP